MATTPDPVLTARSRLAGLRRHGEPHPAAVTDAKRELNAAHLERAIRKALDEAPPLTAKARASLAALLLSRRGK